MMMHQLLHWPEQFDPALWPFALEHAVFIWNNMPQRRSGLTPLELFTGMKQPTNGAILRLRVWGCPSYVLDPKLQDGKKLPKWSKRSCCGVYLGISPKHHTTVGRILNPETGLISPQYHVVYDELYSTVKGFLTDTVFDADTWNSILSLDGLENLVDERDRTNKSVMAPAKDLYKRFVHNNDATAATEPMSDSDSDCDSITTVSEGEDLDFDDEEETSALEGAPQSEDPPPEPPFVVPEGAATAPPTPLLQDHEPHYQTRSGWYIFKPTFAATLMTPGQPRPAAQRYSKHLRECYLAGGVDTRKVQARLLQDHDIHKLNWDPQTFLTTSSQDTRLALRALLQACEDGDKWHHLALLAKGEDPEFNPTWEQAMNGPLAEGYKAAANTEVDTLAAMDVYEEVKRESWMNVLPGTWAFKKKVFPSGLVRKLKARFCVRGNRQVYGKDYFSTFAPTVSWTTVRLLLILSVQMNLANKQVDETAAFVHADIDLPPDYAKMTKEEKARQGVFVEMPRGFAKQGYVWKLKKLLYGLCQSPCNFFLHLKSKLEAIGFEQATEVDPCLFISDKVICLVYVDDTLLFAREMADIDEVLTPLVDEQGMALEVEDDVAGFLGGHMKPNPQDSTITLTQQGPINRIIDALGCRDLPPVMTPAEEVLGKDENGEPPNCTFNYASVIGMLWYVYRHSRPDLGFAVSQAARFAFKPTRKHELALIRIGQYLKGNADKGLVLKPIDTNEMVINAYVDSDFLGIYGKERRNDPDNVKSRQGYVLCLNGCPIIWASKLMDSIALSTMMAEYYALSGAMRELLPLRQTLQAVGKGMGISETSLTTFKTTVWEDNTGALALAKLDPGQHTARSRHFDVKTHWFWSKLKGNEEADDQGRAKFNPLADWSWADVWHYIATHDVPFNPLHDEFMPSIGCAPCTRAIAVGEDFRAGRWWWEDEKAKECGLHVKDAPAAEVSMIGAPR